MSDRIEHLDEGTIHAWLDGALSPDESARMESHANSCADCAALVAEARGLVAASSRILASLDAVPAGVIPGSGTGTDQLAALRARRAADSRRWWRDRRFVAAASLVLVAGVSSLVWRTSPNQSPVAMEASRAIDSVMPPAAAPSPAPTAVANLEALPPARDTAPVRVATRRADSATTNAKVAARGPVPTAGEMTAESRAAGAAGQLKDVANAARVREAAVGAAVVSSQRQAIDSTKALARGDSSAFERKVQQQVQTAPTPPRIIPDQQQQGATRPASPAPLAVRNRGEADAASFGASLRLANAPLLAGSCYEIRPLDPSGDGPGATADTVRLFDERVPERSDPAWFVARRTRVATVGVMPWRLVDSITVEMRSSPAANAEVWRFHTRTRVLYEGGGQVVATIVPDVQGLRNVRPMWGTKVDCR